MHIAKRYLSRKEKKLDYLKVSLNKTFEHPKVINATKSNKITVTG